MERRHILKMRIALCPERVGKCGKMEIRKGFLEIQGTIARSPGAKAAWLGTESPIRGWDDPVRKTPRLIGPSPEGFLFEPGGFSPWRPALCSSDIAMARGIRGERIHAG
jgi:hypothetical protein